MKKTKTDLGVEGTYGTTSVKDNINIPNLQNNITAMFQQLGEGHYSDPTMFTTVSSLCSTNYTEDGNRYFTLHIWADKDNPEKDRLGVDNNISKVFPILAF